MKIKREIDFTTIIERKVTVISRGKRISLFASQGFIVEEAKINLSKAIEDVFVTRVHISNLAKFMKKFSGYEFWKILASFDFYPVRQGRIHMILQKNRRIYHYHTCSNA